MHAGALCIDTLSARFERLAPPSSTGAAVCRPPPGTVATGTERAVDKSGPKGVWGDRRGQVGAVRSLKCSGRSAKESSGRHPRLCRANGTRQWLRPRETYLCFTYGLGSQRHLGVVWTKPGMEVGSYVSQLFLEYVHACVGMCMYVHMCMCACVCGHVN